MKKRWIHIIFFLFFLTNGALCQKITNVRAEQKADKIVVYYDLSGKADVSLSLKVDGKKRPITRIVGDVGKNQEKGQDKQIVWDVLSEYPDGFYEDDVKFEVKATPVWRTFVLAEGAISPIPLQGSGGFIVGRAARWGYYLKFRSSFMFAPSSDGTFTTSWIETKGNRVDCTESDINKLITGKKKNTELVCDAGGVFNFSMNPEYPMYLYLGVGYGLRKQMWEFNNGEWMKYASTAHEGVSVDLGGIFSYKNFLFDIGLNTINFQYVEIQFGLGWLFNK